MQGMQDATSVLKISGSKPVHPKRVSHTVLSSVQFVLHDGVQTLLAVRQKKLVCHREGGDNFGKQYDSFNFH